MAESLLDALLHQALLLTLAIALLWAARVPLLRLGAGARYAAWTTVPALLLTPALPRSEQTPLSLALSSTTGAVAPALPALPAAPADSATIWLALWLLGTAAVLAIQALRQWRLAALGDMLPAGSSPALVGLLRPRIALPADFEQRFPAAQRELILAHEEVHRRRGDNAWNLLACLLTALHWWNPLAWWAASRMRADQELACDAAVLAARPAALAEYTQALLAAHGLTSHGAPLASRWGTTHPLVERIAMLKRPLPLNRRRAALLALLTTCAVGITYATQASPPTHVPDTDDHIKLTLMLAVQQGNTVQRTSRALIGKAGERLRVSIGSEGQAPIHIDLTATDLDDKGYRLEIAPEGLPPQLKVARPSMTPHWEQPHLFESIDEQGSSRFTLFVIGKRTSAPARAPQSQS